MDKSKFYNISGKDIRTIEIRFNNGESIFIPCKQLRKLDINLTSVVDVIDSPIFKYAFLFSVGSIEVDKSFLQQMLGTNDLYDKLNYRNGINSVVIEYNNDYKVSSDIPMMLCLVEVASDSTGTTKLKYEDDDNNFIISWIHTGWL